MTIDLQPPDRLYRSIKRRRGNLLAVSMPRRAARGCGVTQILSATPTSSEQPLACKDGALTAPDHRLRDSMRRPVELRPRCVALTNGRRQLSDGCATNSNTSTGCLVGVKSCQTDRAAVMECIEQNTAPSCALLPTHTECSAAENPFGVTEGNMATCISECATSTTPTQRQCSFSTSCDPTFGKFQRL